jgi:hypothetical protein
MDTLYNDINWLFNDGQYIIDEVKQFLFKIMNKPYDERRDIIDKHFNHTMLMNLNHIVRSLRRIDKYLVYRKIDPDTLRITHEYIFNDYDIVNKHYINEKENNINLTPLDYQLYDGDILRNYDFIRDWHGRCLLRFYYKEINKKYKEFMEPILATNDV